MNELKQNKEIDFNWIECAVIRYRQGEITVLVDFDRNLLTWKDSNRWFNDFVRNISPLQAEKIKSQIHNLLQVYPPKKTFNYEADEQFIWRLRLGQGDNQVYTWETGGTASDAPTWSEFVKTIEAAGEQTLDPLGGH